MSVVVLSCLHIALATYNLVIFQVWHDRVYESTITIVAWNSLTKMA